MSSAFFRIRTVSVATMASRVLGLFRDMLTAAVFGTSLLHSAFLTAFTVPNLFRRLLGEGALTAALVPVLSTELDRGGRESAFLLLNKVLTRLLVVCLVLVGCAWVIFFGLQNSGWLSGRWLLVVGLLQWLFPYVLLVCIAALFAAALNVLERFLLPALTAVWLNLAILVSLGGLGWWYGETEMEKMYFLVAGVLAGGVLQAILPACQLLRLGWRPRMVWESGDSLTELYRLLLPGVFGAAIFQVNLLLSRLLAYVVDESAATFLYLANRIVELPMGVFVIAIATVLFPRLSRLAARPDPTAMIQCYREGLAATLLLAVPAALGLAILGRELISVLFERGAFQSADTRVLASVLWIFCAGTPFYAFLVFITRTFHSLKDTATPVRAAFGAFGANLVLSLVLMWPLGVYGLALASNLAVVGQCWWLQRVLGRKNPGFRWRESTPFLAGLLVANLALAATLGVMYLLWEQLGIPGFWWILTGVPAGGGVYLALLFLLRVPGRNLFLDLLRRKRVSSE